MIEPWIAIITAFGSTLVWTVVFMRVLMCAACHREHRRAYLAMSLTAMLASFGTLASALGFAIQLGIIQIEISREVLTLGASMGRGALLAAGIIVLSTYRPPKAER